MNPEDGPKIAAEKEGALGLAVLASIELEAGKVEKGRFLYDEAYLHSNLRSLGKAKDALALYCLGMMEIDNPPINVPKALRHIEAAAESRLCHGSSHLRNDLLHWYRGCKEFRNGIKMVLISGKAKTTPWNVLPWNGLCRRRWSREER